MANEGFNGTTFAFGVLASEVAIAPLTSVSHSNSGAEVQITGSTDGTHLYVAGKADPSLTIELVGATTLVQGTTGSALVTWFDQGSTGDALTVVLNPSVIIGVDTDGSIDDAITSSVTIRPTRA